MSGNTFGTFFTVSTAGESHGPGLVAVVDGCPPQIPLSIEDLQVDLDRRKPGQSKHTTQRREEDRSKFYPVFSKEDDGYTHRSLIRNTDQRSKDYSQIKDVFRPAHADYTYEHKYGFVTIAVAAELGARDGNARGCGRDCKKFSLTCFQSRFEVV